MPEDDFDIYGEDDGFSTKGQVVRCKPKLVARGEKLTVLD